MPGIKNRAIGQVVQNGAQMLRRKVVLHNFINQTQLRARLASFNALFIHVIESCGIPLKSGAKPTCIQNAR